MEMLYYPGCSVEYTAKMYDISARASCKALGIELKDLDDWNCCGATTYISIRELVAHGNSARNLALARKSGAQEVLTVCPACYLTLFKTNDYFRNDPEFAASIRTALRAAGLDYDGELRIRHLLDVVVNDVGEDKVRAKVEKPLSGLKVAPYHGCMLTRPYEDFDSAERPQVMDKLLSYLGATPMDYPLTAKCCGGMVTNTEPEKVVPVVAGLLRSAKACGADCIAVACPLCHMNLDFYQPEVNKYLGGDYTMPILYFTQLMGLAFGVPKQDLGIGMELVSADRLVSQYV